jgi:hypothetical protein
MLSESYGTSRTSNSLWFLDLALGDYGRKRCSNAVNRINSEVLWVYHNLTVQEQ